VEEEGGISEGTVGIESNELEGRSEGTEGTVEVVGRGFEDGRQEEEEGEEEEG